MHDASRLPLLVKEGDNVRKLAASALKHSVRAHAIVLKESDDGLPFGPDAAGIN